MFQLTTGHYHPRYEIRPVRCHKYEAVSLNNDVKLETILTGNSFQLNVTNQEFCHTLSRLEFSMRKILHQAEPIKSLADQVEELVNLISTS